MRSQAPREQIAERARIIRRHAGIAAAVESGALAQFAPVSVSEALVLGLLNQGVRKYVGVFGHGTTDIANILSVYEDACLARMWNVRNEIEAAHSATMLRSHYGETCAVINSIGPGALQAFAGSHGRPNLQRLIAVLKAEGFRLRETQSEWLSVNRKRREDWERFKRLRCENPVLQDPVWNREVLTQPAAIKIALDFAPERGAACYFDAGDVQATGSRLRRKRRSAGCSAKPAPPTWGSPSAPCSPAPWRKGPSTQLRSAGTGASP